MFTNLQIIWIRLMSPTLQPRWRFFVAISCLLSFLVAVPVKAQQLLKLTASNPAQFESFGRSVAVSGKIAVVGVPGNDYVGSFGGHGSAYVFDVTTGQKLFELKASDRGPGDQFGWSVAVSGQKALIGSYADDEPSDSGAAYIFDITTGQQLFKLKAADANFSDHFGESVALDGNNALVGAYTKSDLGFATGAAYLFNASTGAQLHKLISSDAAVGRTFGSSVAIHGNRALVGATGNPTANYPGAAYLFDVATGQEVLKLTASDGMPRDGFGGFNGAVALSDNLALVGAMGDNPMGPGTYGGGTGSAYLFDAHTGQQLFKLIPSDLSAGDHFGRSVALSGQFALIGSYQDDDAGNSSGSAYIFDVTTGQQLIKLTAGDAAAEEHFGYSLAAEGNLTLIGAAWDGGTSQAGSVYLFQLGPTVPEPSTLLLAALAPFALLHRRVRNRAVPPSRGI